MDLKNTPTCTLHDRFSSTEKLSMRIGWMGFMALAAYAIYKQDPFWAWAYGAYVVIGFALVVPSCLCSHCPYPYQYSACLFNPPGLLRKLFAYRGPEVPPSSKIVAFAVMAGIVVLPQFWLINDIPLLITFWVIALPMLAVFPLHFCKHCRHVGCPINKATET